MRDLARAWQYGLDPATLGRILTDGVTPEVPLRLGGQWAIHLTVVDEVESGEKLVGLLDGPFEAARAL